MSEQASGAISEWPRPALRAATIEHMRIGFLFGIRWGVALFVLLCFLALFRIGADDYLRVRVQAARGEAAAEYIRQELAKRQPPPPAVEGK